MYLFGKDRLHQGNSVNPATFMHMLRIGGGAFAAIDTQAGEQNHSIIKGWAR